MIPYSYNMVDMGGIDLAEANGTVVQGLYSNIVEAMNLCGDVILYNWKFANIEIAPSACSVIQESNAILINGLIQVTELDQVTIIGLPPPIVPVVPLTVHDNGEYVASAPVSGFNPVVVDVEKDPVITPLTATANGTYYIPEGVDGFGPVIVDVPYPLYRFTVSISGGYNGGAILTVTYRGNEIYRAIGSSPYNLSYTPPSYSGVLDSRELSIVPYIPANTSRLTVTISYGDQQGSVSFLHTGTNSSYGYGDQSDVITFIFD